MFHITNVIICKQFNVVLKSHIHEQAHIYVHYVHRFFLQLGVMSALQNMFNVLRPSSRNITQMKAVKQAQRLVLTQLLSHTPVLLLRHGRCSKCLLYIHSSSSRQFRNSRLEHYLDVLVACIHMCVNRNIFTYVQSQRMKVRGDIDKSSERVSTFKNKAVPCYTLMCWNF